MSSVHHLARRLWSNDLTGAARLASAALAPAETLYRLGVASRNLLYDRRLLPSSRAQIRVISVGNIGVGGSGKTPFAGWLVQELQRRGEKPALVHGGYAADEPELHRAWNPDVPVVVERDRVRAVGRAAEAGATVAVLDDAFQHRRLRRDVDIVLVTVERWSMQVRLLPRGPWREPPGALRRADLIVCVRRAASAERAAQMREQLAEEFRRPVATILLAADAWTVDGHRSGAPQGDAVLVAGIAEPGLLSDNARAAGACVATELIFADHHDYTAADADMIMTAASGRPIVTTAKDWVKLRNWLDAAPAYVLEQRVIVEQGREVIDRALERALQ